MAILGTVSMLDFRGVIDDQCPFFIDVHACVSTQDAMMNVEHPKLIQYSPIKNQIKIKSIHQKTITNHSSKFLTVQFQYIS